MDDVMGKVTPMISDVDHRYSTKDIGKMASIKTEKTFVDIAMKGNVTEEKKIDTTIQDQHYSERESKRLVKRGVTNDNQVNKPINEDIPFDIKERKRQKKKKSPANTGRLARSQDKVAGAYQASSSKKYDDQLSPKKKFQALKTKFIKLNEHLKQSEAEESLAKKMSQSPMKYGQ